MHILHSFNANALLLTALFSPAFFTTAAAQQTIIDENRINVGGFNPNGTNAIDGINVKYDTTRNRFVVVYAEQNGTGQTTQDIYSVYSDDEGLTWSAPTRVDLGDAPNNADSDFPKLAITASGDYVAVWQETRDQVLSGSSNQDVFYNRSTDGGVTWGATSIALNTATAGSNIDTDIDRVYLASDGDNVYVTWEEDSGTVLGGNEEIQFARSTNSGASFMAPVVVSQNYGPGQSDVDEPQVHADNGLVIITYTDGVNGNDQAFLIRSTDNGANFSAPIQIESDPTGNVDEIFSALDGTVVLCGWTDSAGGQNDAIRAAISLDGGQTFGPEQICGPNAELNGVGDADGPSVELNGQNAYIVWASDHLSILNGGTSGSSGNQIFLSYTNDGGTTWNHEIELEPGVINNRPLVETDPATGTVHVWTEHNPNGSNIPAFAYSADGGATFSAFTEVPSAGPDVDEGNFPAEGEHWAVSPQSNTLIVGHFDRPLGQNEVYISGQQVQVALGTNYCGPAVANSTGQPGVIAAIGSLVVATNQFSLRANGLPQNQFGIFITSLTQGFIPMPGNSMGNICLGGAIGRYNGPGQVQSSGGNGSIEIMADLTATPSPSGPVAVSAGETRNFQAWYRDLVGGAPTSNFTDATTVVFQ